MNQLKIDDTMKKTRSSFVSIKKPSKLNQMKEYFNDTILEVFKQIILPAFTIICGMLFIFWLMERFVIVDSVITRKGYDELKTELTYGEIRCNKDGFSYIHLNNKSSLKGYSLVKSLSFYPYQILSNDGFTYGILIFSKEYFLVKEIIESSPCYTKEPVKF